MAPLRILVVSSFYPSERSAGNESGCRDLVEALRARGHRIRVLAGPSSIRVEQPEEDVWRGLQTVTERTFDWRAVFFKEWTNQNAFRSAEAEFSPDVVLFFDLSQVSVSLVWLAEKMGLPFIFYLTDTWFILWERDQWRQLWPHRQRGFRVLRGLSRRFDLLPPEKNLPFGKAVFVNSHLNSLALELGLTNEEGVVIPWGVDLRSFYPPQARRSSPTRLLYVGQLMPHKGLDVAIKALGVLKRQSRREDLSLTIQEIKKEKPGPDFRPYFYALARGCGVENIVKFEAPRPRQAMPELYRTHDVMIFPPASDDSLSLHLLEAMACGMATVATLTTGNADVLKSEKNALLFPAENPARCADQVRMLLDNPALFEALSSEARRTVEQGFRLEKTVLALEEELTKIRKPIRDAAHREPMALLAASNRAAGRLRRWLFWGAILVTVRALLKPGFYGRLVTKIVDKGSSLTALLLFPFFLGIFFRLAGRRNPHRQPGKKWANRIKSVLVVQLADMGDVLLSGPFLRELRSAVPRARITLVVQPSMANPVEKCPYVDEIVFFPWRAARNWRNAFSGSLLWWFQSAWITARKLWKQRVDIAFSLRWNNDPCQAASLILMYTSGASIRVGYQDFPHHLSGYKLTDVNRLITQGPVRGFPEHEVERQLDLLSSVGIKVDKSAARMELWTDLEDEKFARYELDRSGFPREGLLIAFAPGAAWEFRRWPAERFIELGRWLQEKHEAYLLIFAARNEARLASQIEKALDAGRTLNLAGKTTIRQMGSLLRHCRIFVGNDSGPMHVAVAAGIPVVGLFGPGEYERFRPWGPEHEVLRLTFPCSPCSQSCFFESARCIRGLSLSRVKEVIARKLSL